MKRLLLTLAVMLVVAGTARAQEKIVSTQVFVEGCNSNAAFYVDGTMYGGSTTFLWPEGSRHILEIQPVQLPGPGMRCTATGWTDSKGNLLPDGARTAFTATGTVTSVKGISVMEYRLWVDFLAPGAAVVPFSCTPGPETGKIYVNGACLTASTEYWLSPNSKVQLMAQPPNDFVFLGWVGVPGLDGQSFDASFALISPMTVSPRFAQAALINLNSVPSGLQLLADRTLVITPASLSVYNRVLPAWGEGTTHLLGPVSPQTDEFGKLWVFDSWSNGAPAQQSYKVGPRYPPITLTATFIPAARVSLVTNPPNLSLSVDGRENWPGYNFVWGAGTKHSVSAPAEQVDERGQRWYFTSWAQGGDATQDLIVPDSAVASGLRWTANYAPMGKLTVRGTPANVKVLLDGAECVTPCTLSRRPGGKVVIKAPTLVQVSESSRMDFQGWGDSGSPERTWTAGTEAQTLTASYGMSYKLTAVATPPAAATLRVEPRTPDGFYAADADVNITVEPATGYRLAYWQGDLRGLSLTATLRMSAPRNVQAVLQKTPELRSTSVANAAASLPDPGVAPGSIISIYGVNLAPDVTVGPSSPLAQSLSQVTVQLGDWLLPLFYVSPAQINALLPSDLEPGDYSLTVRLEGLPGVKTAFQVVRNAPGLFAQSIQSQQFALASHEDGSPVTPDSPAKKGELITLLGTGFGPCTGRYPDGFAVPDKPLFPLADPVEIPVGDQVVQPEWAGAAAGMVGVTAVKVRITDVFPAAATFELKVRMNGRLSNTVLLPLK